LAETRISKWAPVGIYHVRVVDGAPNRDCPKKNATYSRDRTGVGARRNRRLSPLGHSIPPKKGFIVLV